MENFVDFVVDNIKTIRTFDLPTRRKDNKGWGKMMRKSQFEVRITERTTIVISGFGFLDACMNSGYPAAYFKDIFSWKKLNN